MSKSYYSKCIGYILLVAIGCLSTIHVQAQRYHFIQYGVEEGLPQSQVEAISQDHNAHLWIGTRGGGLSRFNGHSFENFTTSNGLASNQINDLYTDTEGNIWIASDAGLSMIDRKSTSRKLNSMNNWYSGTQLPSGPIYCVTEDDKGNIWIGSTSGLLELPKNPNKPNGRGDPAAFKANEINSDVYSITFAFGMMWIGLEEQIIGFDGVQMIHHKLQSNAGRVNDIQASKEHEIIVACNAGIAHFAVDGQSLALLDWKSRRKAHVLHQDSKGQVWAGTDNGALRFNGDAQTDFTTAEGLNSDIIRDVFEDNEGNIWFGTGGGGLNRFSNKRFTQFNIKEDEEVNLVQSFAEDDQGELWMGTFSGLYILKEKGFSPFIVSNIFTRFDVRSVHYDQNGFMWYSIIGFGVFQVKGEDVENVFTTEEGLSSNDVYDIAEDSSGRIFLATAAGLSIINGTNASPYLIKGEALRGRFNAVEIDHSGRLWAGSQHGALLLDGDEKQQFTQKDGLSSNAIRAICRGKRGEMWLGTDNGIIRVDASKVVLGSNKQKGNIFTIFSTGEGMRSHLVNALATDNKHNLWIGTNVGVERFDLEEYYVSGNIRFTYFNKDEGFTGVECNPNAILKDHKGRMWFGTPKGAVVYDPAEDVPNPLPPILKINDIRLFEEEVDWSLYANELDETTGFPKNLVLPYDKNYLSFNFIGISLSASDKVRYKYRMKGFDQDWLPITNVRSARYRILPAGDFTFEVLSSNNSGVWNETPATFSFSIKQPYWQEAWFIGLMAVLGLGIIGASFYMIFDRRVQKKELDERIANLRLNAMRAQMNPHFIFNSLNSIQNFINKNDEESANIYLSQFASLMRLILDNSQQSSIPVGEEVRSLKLYLSLEKLRFKEKFDFDILVDDSVDQLEDQIPTMLIQPYVENALNHGILHKEGPGIIKLAISREEGSLIVQIQDDGIGREKAMEIKNRQAKRHRSAGMGITRERLEILNTISHNNMSVTITDLFTPDQRAAGTLVKITVPLTT